MIKTLKKIILGSVSILGVSVLIWLVLLFNPQYSYAHQTQVDQVIIYHNDALQQNAEKVVRDAIGLI